MQGQDKSSLASAGLLFTLLNVQLAMGNIKKLAPYAYLARRSDTQTIYDLYLLVPVDAERTVDLSNVQPAKGPGTRITIPYPTTEPGAPAPPPRPGKPAMPPPAPKPAPASSYKFRHWEIDSEGTYLDICIQADDREDLSTLIAFADADTEPGTGTEEHLVHAPYLFLEKYREGEHFYFRPSCIVLFRENTGIREEELTLHGMGATLVVTPGDRNLIIRHPEDLSVNRNLRQETSGPEYHYKVIIMNNSELDITKRQGKISSQALNPDRYENIHLNFNP